MMQQFVFCFLMACLVARCVAFLPKSHLRRGSLLFSAVGGPPPTPSPISWFEAYRLFQDSENKLRAEQEKASDVVIRKLDEIKTDMAKGMLELRTDFKELKTDFKVLDTKFLWFNVVGFVIVAILGITAPSLREFLSSIIGNVFKL